MSGNGNGAKLLHKLLRWLARRPTTTETAVSKQHTDYDHWDDVPENVWRWPHFSPDEIACQHCGRVRLVPDAMDRLEAVRLLYGRPIRIVSAYRCAEHPIEASKAEPGSHNRGAAFDVSPLGIAGDLAALEDAFFQVGVLGRGKGLKDGVLHLHFDWDAVLGRRSWGY